MVELSYEIYRWFLLDVLNEFADIQLSYDFQGLVFLIFFILVPFLVFKFIAFVLDLCWRFVQ